MASELKFELDALLLAALQFFSRCSMNVAELVKLIPNMHMTTTLSHGLVVNEKIIFHVNLSRG